MKTSKYIYFFIAFLLIYIIFLLYINTTYEVEEFTPYIRKVYRPYVRHVRLVGEGFYVKHKTNVTNIFRKFGIM